MTKLGTLQKGWSNSGSSNLPPAIIKITTINVTPRHTALAHVSAAGPVITHHVGPERLLEGEAVSITRQAIDMAKAGDGIALRPVLERVMPLRRGRPVPFESPTVATAGEDSAGLGGILTAVADGRLAPDEGATVAQHPGDKAARAGDGGDGRAASEAGGGCWEEAAMNLERRLELLEDETSPVVAPNLLVVPADMDDARAA